MKFDGSPEAERLLESWKGRCRESQKNHYIAANRCIRWNRLIGVPAIVCSTVVGTGVLVSLALSVNFYWKIGAALTSMVAAVLTGLQVNLNHAERAERHKNAGARYAGVRRRIEELLAIPPESPDELRHRVSRILDQMNALAEQSPALPPDLWGTGGAFTHHEVLLGPSEERIDKIQST